MKFLSKSVTAFCFATLLSASCANRGMTLEEQIPGYASGSNSLLESAPAPYRKFDQASYQPSHQIVAASYQGFYVRSLRWGKGVLLNSEKSTSEEKTENTRGGYEY